MTPLSNFSVLRRLLAGAGFVSMVLVGASLGAPRAWADGPQESSVLPAVDASLWPVRALDIHNPAGLDLQLSEMSNDGPAFSGTRIDRQSGSSTAFRWTAEHGVQDIVIPEAKKSEASFISEDGSLVRGTFVDTQDHVYGFQWTTRGGLQKIGDANWTRVEVQEGANDGSTVVGTAWYAHDNGHSRAFYWTAQEGVRPLVDDRISALLKFTPTDTGAYGISYNAPSVIAGWAKNAQTGQWAIFRLDRARGDVQIIGRGQSLTSLPQWMFVSIDGSILFGMTGDTPYIIFRWTQRSGLEQLFPGSSLRVSGVSFDGSKVFGTYAAGGQTRLFVWTERTGAHDAGLAEPGIQYFVNDRAIFKVRMLKP